MGRRDLWVSSGHWTELGPDTYPPYQAREQAAAPCQPGDTGTVPGRQCDQRELDLVEE